MTAGPTRATCGALFALLAPISMVQAAPAPDAAPRQVHKRALLTEFLELLRIPNVASDTPNIRRNAQAIAAMMQRRGLAPQILTDPNAPEAPPLVYGEWKTAGAAKTLMFYAHYDGQPVNPAAWRDGPWSATLRRGPQADAPRIDPKDPTATDPEVRVYARGAGDDKAGVMAILGAIDVLRAAGRHPTDNIKIIFEGEEEAGSPHLGALLSAHRKLMAADLWVVCDGPAQASGGITLTYGVRGDANVDLAVYGPIRALHSGHYGNWAPNPGLRLARLLSSMKDEHGRVTIAGWYDDVMPLGEMERRAIAAAAAREGDLRRELAIAEPETNAPLALATTEPSLNINGMRSGDIGADAANVIPDKALAVLDLRLVLGERPLAQFDKLAAHVRAQGYLVLDRAPTADERLANPLIATLTMRPGAYSAARTPMDNPLAHSLATAIRAASTAPPVELPASGGSLPLSVITDTLGTSALIVSIANHDNNQHAANENLRLGNLWTGVEVITAMLRR